MSNPTNNSDPIYSYQPLWGSWYIDSLIGEGSFGKVYRIVRSELGYSYTSAVKIITIPSKEQLRQAISSFGDDKETLRVYFEGMVENILSEVNLLYRLRANPNIIIYEDHMVGKKKDDIGWDILLRMEYATALTEYLKKERLKVEEIINLSIDILTAISICNKNNIIHRDIKDENIFVSDNKTFKLGDFGIAKELSKSGRAASFRGTPLFMSPEVFKGEKYDIRSDLYSLGIVIYKLLNKGRIPFMPPYPHKVEYKDSDNALIKRLTGSPIQPPAYALSKELSSVVLKAVSYNKEDRYASPDDMKKDLYRILSTTGESVLNRYVTALPSLKQEKIESTIHIHDIPKVVKKVEEIKPEDIQTPEAKETYEEIQHIPPTIPWYKKPWAIASFSLFFITALSLSLFFTVYKTYQDDKPKETSEAVVEPNEESILFVSNRDSKNKYIKINHDGSSNNINNNQIYIINLDNKEVLKITDNIADNWAPTCSKDGTKIAFESNMDGDYEIYIINVDGSNLIKLTNNSAYDCEPSFSPDGNKIVFRSDRQGNDEIYTINVDGTGLFRVTDNTLYDCMPEWSPDGKKILYTSINYSEINGNANIYSINIDGTDKKNLTENSFNNLSASWSPDGEKIVFVSDKLGDLDLYTMDKNGSNQSIIISNEGRDFYPSWSSDGKKIIFMSDKDGDCEIFMVNLDGSNLIKITDNDYFNGMPEWLK